jgi:hypothetical protein
MARLLDRISWRPSKTTLVAGALIVLGIVLTDVSWGFVFLVGLGMLGPGLLRELGWLKDQDEFQRQAARRAGYHAFLATGLIAFLLEGVLRTGGHGIHDPEEVVDTLLCVLWFTWVLSSLLAYWGPRRTARTILVTFGIFWFIFAVADSLGSLVGFIMNGIIAVPFFVLAWASGRWPKAAGDLFLLALRSLPDLRAHPARDGARLRHRHLHRTARGERHRALGFPRPARGAEASPRGVSGGSRSEGMKPEHRSCSGPSYFFCCILSCFIFRPASSIFLPSCCMALPTLSAARAAPSASLSPMSRASRMASSVSFSVFSPA